MPSSPRPCSTLSISRAQCTGATTPRARCSLQAALDQDRRPAPRTANIARSRPITPRPPASKRETLLDVDDVLQKARRAKAAGATRFCMGAAWREVKDGEAFDSVLAMVRGVKELGMEACVTLGMLTDAQARPPRRSGPHRLQPQSRYLARVLWRDRHHAHLPGPARHARARPQGRRRGLLRRHYRPGREPIEDRARLLQTLANLVPHPESVPINALAAVPGTPLGDQPPVDPLDLVRMVAAARIMMPLSRVSLSAGRRALTREAQILCFFAGANSIFYGDKLLTTANNDAADDLALIEEAGLSVQAPSPAE